jgi:glycosyltransferase involved in cell wall biosynthesis
MDSSLGGQMTEKYPLLRPLGGILRAFEKGAIRKSSGVIAVCRILEDMARQLAPNKPVLRLEDVPLPRDASAPRENLREKYAIAGKIVMYVGNLEHYQGMDLLLNSFQMLTDSEASLVIIGGNAKDIADGAKFAAKLGIGNRVRYIGPRPLEQLFGFLVQADILVSPRVKGINTPMKIYSYLDSGVPVLATNLPTHTQVLDDRIALLVEAEPAAMAAGLETLLRDDRLRVDLARRARERVSRDYSTEAFRKKLCAFYDGLALG